MNTLLITMENSGNDSSTNDNIDTVPCISNMNVEISPPFQVILSDNPIDDIFDIKIDIKGAPSTLGLKLIMDAISLRSMILGVKRIHSCKEGVSIQIVD